MTMPSGYRATAKMRTEPLDERRTKFRDVPGWSCTCGSNQGRTVMATMGDAQNAADLHTRQSHPGTLLGDLEAAIADGGIRLGVKFLGDSIAYVQEADHGTYIETAAKGRFMIDPDGKASVYLTSATRPPVPEPKPAARVPEPQQAAPTTQQQAPPDLSAPPSQ